MRSHRIVCTVIGAWLFSFTAAMAHSPGAQATRSKAAKSAPPSAAAGAKASTPIRVEHLLQVTSPVYQPQPQYPTLAKAARIQGTVRLDAVIARDGTVKSLKLVSGHPLLVKAAMDAAEKWRYRPPRINGQPAEIEALIEVKFSLPPCSLGDDSCWSDALRPPRPYYRPDPPYTTEARRAGIYGTVTLTILVGADGRVSDVHVTRPLDKGLDEQAVKTVKTWKFHPAMSEGKPVAESLKVDITFRLQ